MAANKKPRKIVVGSMTFKIIWNQELKKAKGLCKYVEQEIMIDSRLDEASKRHVLLHEIYHAIWYAYSFTPRMVRKHLEEDVVSHFPPAFIDTMDLNPKVREYLFPCVGE